ncbi:MAG: hypothetical protein JJ992_09420, partial [Planctomycetes bacterium]|nr:hypothetical protein [Planctomycetota bacterium]
MTRIWAALLFVSAMTATAIAAESESAAKKQADVYERTVSKAIEYLTTKGQAEDGSYSSHTGTGVTSLVTAALLRHGRTVQDPVVAKSLKVIEASVQPDGGIYQPDSLHRNYETCLAIFCLTEANKDGRYDKL